MSWTSMIVKRRKSREKIKRLEKFSSCSRRVSSHCQSRLKEENGSHHFNCIFCLSYENLCLMLPAESFFRHFSLRLKIMTAEIVQTGWDNRWEIVLYILKCSTNVCCIFFSQHLYEETSGSSVVKWLKVWVLSLSSSSPTVYCVVLGKSFELHGAWLPSAKWKEKQTLALGNCK